MVEERLGLQRANVPLDVSGVKTPLMSYEAVSYTHLDVYKRQKVFCATNHWLYYLKALLSLYIQ